MFWLRLGSSVGLSVLFIVVYGGSNWLAAQRSNVPSVFFEWELMIPFVPAMILPYMSIDLFFVTAPFLCRDRTELAMFSRRIAFSILVGGAFFLVFPLKFSFARPQAAGILGGIFDWFRTMDQPFNQFPSLHVALSVLLLEVYLRRFRGAFAWTTLIAWFILIASSTVLTFQHHAIDIAGGAILALAAMRIFPRGGAGAIAAEEAGDRARREPAMGHLA